MSGTGHRRARGDRMDAVGQHVVVDGWGALAMETAAQLRRVLPRIRAGAHAADAAELEVAAGLEPPAALVLVAEGDTAAWEGSPSALAPWHVARVPVLTVVTGHERTVVGPLVVPGVPPCLGCARPVGRPTGLGPPPGPDPAAAVLAAAVATVTVLGVLDGDVSLAGISTEVGPRGTTVGHRVWTSRPDCRCTSVRMAG